MKYKIFCFLYLLSVFFFDVCLGLTWGSWNVDRARNSNYKLTGGTQYDELQSILAASGISVSSSEMISELTADNLSNTNVFWTGYLYLSNTLTLAEQDVLHEWVQVKGGVFVVGGCYGNQYASCRSYLEPFGLNSEEPHYSGSVTSTCSGEHMLLDGVDEMQHTNPQVLAIGQTAALPLCKLSEGQVIVSLLQYGWGYIVVSDMYMYLDGHVGQKDNTKFVQNLIAWTEQLECDNLEGCPEITRLPGQCDFGRIVCTSAEFCTDTVCDSETGCTSETNCDDHDLCTLDFCAPDGGCTYEAVVCDDYDACTLDSCDPASGDCLHENPEVCYPTIADTADRIREVQTMVEQLKKQIVPSPTPSVTKQPTSIPTIVSTPVVTHPPARAIALPTALPTATPTRSPTSQPTDIPMTVIVQGFLNDAVQEMQQFIMDQINQMETRNQAQIAEQTSQIAELRSNLEAIEDKVDKLVSSLYPSPTQVPTTSPTIAPTNSPTLEPARCEAVEDPSRTDFLTDGGTCFQEARECLNENLCSEVLTSPTCQIPFDVLHGPEHCWQNVGFEVPQDVTSTPVSASSTPSGYEVSSVETSFQSWTDVSLCIRRTCDCTSAVGKWNVLVGHISLSLTTSQFACCLACHKTDNCAKWHYQGQICVLLESSATLDEAPDSSAWVRGQIEVS